MKLFIMIISILFLMIVLNIFNYNYFLILLSIIWYIVSLLLIYASFKYSFKYKFIQFKIGKIIKAIKSKSKNNVSPLSSLCVTLAAKIGVGSLAGVALTLYLGGLGSIFWMMIISLFLSINTYVECVLGIKYRVKRGSFFIGGPSIYIKRCLGNKYLSILYGILIIITYSGLFMSIQSNTIINIFNGFNINIYIVLLCLILFVFLIIRNGIKNIYNVNVILVPVMLIVYLVLGIFIFVRNDIIPIMFNMIKSAFNLRSIIPVFLLGMQRSIFVSESGIGTSAISSSTCDNDASNQGVLEVMGIHITNFCVCFITFIIIATSNYNIINFGDINGIEIVMYAFNYHFGSIGKILLSVITVMFAFSTIISGYFFGENNLRMFTNNKLIINIFKYFVFLIIIISSFVSPRLLWNLTDFFIAILAFINIIAILKINKN